MHGSNFSDCKCQKIARGFIFAVAKCIFMIFVGKDFYGNMIKTLYCKPAEERWSEIFSKLNQRSAFDQKEGQL